MDFGASFSAHVPAKSRRRGGAPIGQPSIARLPKVTDVAGILSAASTVVARAGKKGRSRVNLHPEDAAEGIELMTKYEHRRANAWQKQFSVHHRNSPTAPWLRRISRPHCRLPFISQHRRSLAACCLYRNAPPPFTVGLVHYAAPAIHKSSSDRHRTFVPGWI